MKHSTVRKLLLLCIVLDLALIGVVVYDYFQNDSDWIVIVLAVFAVFLIITAILFFLAGRGENFAAGERVVERIVEPAPRGDVLPPIPPAPLASKPFVSPVPPPRPTILRAAAPAKRPVRRKRPARPAGPFRYNGYTLHKMEVKLANGNGKRTIYFFSKKKPKSGKPSPKPAGYHVGVNERTGLPFLKKGAGKDGENLTPKSDPGYRPQCSALTADGSQCRNSARQGSKYCGPHFGYQPPTTKGLAKRIEGDKWSAKDKQTDKGTVRKADTKAAVKKARDTQMSVRKKSAGKKSTGRRKRKRAA